MDHPGLGLSSADGAAHHEKCPVDCETNYRLNEIFDRVGAFLVPSLSAISAHTDPDFVFAVFLSYILDNADLVIGSTLENHPKSGVAGRERRHRHWFCPCVTLVFCPGNSNILPRILDLRMFSPGYIKPIADRKAPSITNSDLLVTGRVGTVMSRGIRQDVRRSQPPRPYGAPLQRLGIRREWRENSPPLEGWTAKLDGVVKCVQPNAICHFLTVGSPDSHSVRIGLWYANVFRETSYLTLSDQACLGMSSSKGLFNSSFPRLVLMPISQSEAILTSLMLASASIACRGASLSLTYC